MNGWLWAILGWVAILFPAVYMLVTGWDSGEHTGTVILFGFLASAILGAVWTLACFACRNQPPTNRRAMFGAGATVSLAGSIVVGSVADHIAAAALTYAAITAVVVAVATRHTKTART